MLTLASSVETQLLLRLWVIANADAAACLETHNRVHLAASFHERLRDKSKEKQEANETEELNK